MNKPIGILARVAAAGALVILAQNAQSQVLYNNTTGNQGVNFNYVGSSGVPTGNPSGTAGNEIDLAGSAANDTITGFTFQYDFVGTGTPTGTVDLSFYQNNGTPKYNGYYTPGTLLYNSGPFALTSFTAASQLSYDLADLLAGTGPSVMPGQGICVPDEFTWVVTFAGLTPTESAGLALYNPATVGNNYGNNAWINYDGGGPPTGWFLAASTSPNPPLEFGAIIDGVPCPDSTCLPISVLSVLTAFGWMKRFQRRA